jgi:alpha-1,6-mannosyltransferase
VYHASPYLHAPSAYPHDPFLQLIGSGWRGTRSVYGPLFTAVSTVLTKLAGTSVLRARLAFQGLSLAAVIAALAIVWHQTQSMRAVAFVGLHPAVIIAIVNGGHNDALVGLAVLGAAVLLARRRATAAGVVVALGLLVKASTVFGLVGLAIWVLARDRHRAVRFMLATGVTTAIGYAFTGTAAIRSVAGGAGRTSRASLWSVVSHFDPRVVGTAAALTVAVFAIVGAFRYRNVRLPWLPIGIAFAAYLFAGAYVLPWYAAWALPALALTRRSTVAVVVGGQTTLLVALYELSRHVDADTIGGTARGIGVVSGAVVLVAILITWLVRPGSGDALDTEWLPKRATPVGAA